MGTLILYARKKNGFLKMFIDYRQLNKVNMKNKYPILRIDDVFNQIHEPLVFYDKP